MLTKEKKEKTKKKSARKRNLILILVLSMLLSSFPVYADSSDTWSKTGSIMGIIYSELRYLEIQWASKLRAYGTTAQGGTLKITDTTIWFGITLEQGLQLTFTDQQLDIKDYVTSREGVEDGLGVWIVLSGRGKGEEEGILGPEPFDGASDDYSVYKVLDEIDGGNTLEFRGKPQEGYTSNAKQIAAMTEVYYSQAIDAIKDQASDARGWDKITQSVTNAFRSLWTYFEEKEVPILGTIAKSTGWSWTSIAREYAYPLMQASHVGTFYLAEYIFPTEWSVPSEYLTEATTENGEIVGSTYEDMEDAVPEDGTSDSDEDEITHAWDVSQESANGESPGSSANNLDIGRSTEGGTGKVTTDFQTQNIDNNVVEIEYCPSDEYGGYGCMQTDEFSYLWTGSFATSKWSGSLSGVDILDEEALQTLYYYYMGDKENSEGEYDGAYDVSTDVSPFDSDSQKEIGWCYDACIVHPTVLSKTAVNCWDLDDDEGIEIGTVSGLGLNSYVTLEYYDADHATETESDVVLTMNNEFKWRFADVKNALLGDYSGYDIADIVATPDGFDIYLIGDLVVKSFTEEVFTGEYEQGDAIYETVTVTVHDTSINPYCTGEDGDGCWEYSYPVIVGYEQGDPIYEEHTYYYGDLSETEAVILHYVHDCTGGDGDDDTDGHTGTYCGGHLQLKIRGVVYGWSEEQMSSTLLESVDESSVSSYEPKYLDPVDWDETEGTTPTIDDVSDTEIAAYPDLAESDEPVWLVDNHVTTTDDGDLYKNSGKTPYIADTDAYTAAEDLFDIDVLIKRPKTSYPGYNDETTYALISSSGLTESSTAKWRSWTLSNMGEAISLASTDWKESYDVADTQTIVGGDYETTTGDASDINAVSNEVKEKILNLLGYNELPTLSADLSDPYAVGLDGEVLTAYEREWISRLRHVVYALNTVGMVSYSQLQHGYLYDDISGRLSDCSGYASNIWRDRLNITGVLTTTTFISSSKTGDYAHSYYWNSGDDSPEDSCGISPGDVIIKNNDGEHALIYIGTFRLCDIYDGSDDTDYYVFTVDCSSMKASYSTLEGTSEAVSTNAKSSLSGAGKLFTSVSSVEDDPTVYSGNTRFAARSYLQKSGDHSDIWYIDMTSLEDYILTDEETGFTVPTGEPGTYGADEDTGYEGTDAQVHAQTDGVRMAYNDPNELTMSGNSTIDEEKYLQMLSEFMYDYTFLETEYEYDYWENHTAKTEQVGLTETINLADDWSSQLLDWAGGVAEFWKSFFRATVESSSDSEVLDSYEETGDNGEEVSEDVDEESEDIEEEDTFDWEYWQEVIDTAYEDLVAMEEYEAAALIAELTSDGVDFSFTFPISGYTYTSAIKERLIKSNTNRTSPVSNFTLDGVDIYVDAGTEVLASDSGTVVMSGYSEEYGNYVIIMHESGYYTMYAYLSTTSLAVGDTVEQDEVIGRSGISSDGDACLHYELLASETSISLNPAFFIY